MPLEDSSNIGPGGEGYQGVGSGSAAAVVKELQGLKVALLAGATAGTKIDVAAIRAEDNILSCIENSAGTLTDRTSTTTITSIVATGTLTASTIIAGSACTVAGKTYTFQAAASAIPKYGEVVVGADDNGSILNLRVAINLYESSIERGGAQVIATNATNVCTVTAPSEGTAGNAITLTTANATIVVSGATLAGGSNTGGVQGSVDTSTKQLTLMWYNKQ